MAIERMQVPVGAKFDPSNQQHIDVVMKKVAETGRGTGWEIQSYSAETGLLTINRRNLLTHVDRNTEGKTDSYKVELKRGTKATDGEKVAAELESDPQHEGYYMTRFDPFINQATLSRLNDAELRCRSAVAVALGVKPWDVQVSSRPRGGFLLGLPNTYVPSKHDEKITEVAEMVVGRPGWYFAADAQKLSGEIVPSAPPSFPPVISYPLDLLPAPSETSPSVLAPIPIGMTLADRGDQPSAVTWLDLEAGSHSQVGGTSGAGKTATLNTLIAGALAAGAELAIIDVPAKAVDFELWRPWTRPGGWGCESFEENAIALEQLYKEGTRRAETLKRYGVKKLSQLPADMQTQMKPVLIVVDEVTGLFAMDTVPRQLDREHPLVLEAQSRNLARELIKQYMERIAAEMRFVGFKLVVSTQVASTATGIGTAFRTNLHNKMLLGAKATDGNRKLILRDVTSVPDVPEHIKNDPAVSRGVGVAELEGKQAVVFKSFYASELELIAALQARGMRPLPDTQLDQTRPDPQLVQATFPHLAEVAAMKRKSDAPQYGKGPRQYETWELDPNTGEPLTGFARANAARHAVTKAAQQ